MTINIKYKAPLMFLAALLPVLIFRDFTMNNEMKYLSMAEDALANGHFFCFYDHGEIYADKPPLYLWLVMLCRVLFSDHYMLPLCLFSALPAVITSKVMSSWTGKDSFEQELVFLASLGIISCSAVVRMDMLMTMFIVLALREFWLRYTGVSKSWWRLPLYTFMALFTKGPFGVMVPIVGTTVYLIVKGKIGEWFKYWGWKELLMILGLCALWFGAVYLEGGKEYLNNLVIHQTVDRASNAFVHKQPFWYYLPALIYCFLPWSPFLYWKMYKDKNRSELDVFMLVVAFTFIVIISCVSSKLQIYMLPAWPLIAYSCSGLDGKKWIRTTSYVIFGLVFIGGFCTIWTNPRYSTREVCKQAVELSQIHNASGFAGYKLRSARNMDVFVENQVEELESLEGTNGKVLIFKTDKMKKYPELEELFRNSDHRSGPTYSCMYVD